MKIFWLFNHPAPYKVDFFNALGKHVDLHVLFERASEAGRNAIFYGEKPVNFKAEIARSFKIGGLNNFTLAAKKYLRDRSFDIVVLNGWMTFTEQWAIHYCKKHHIPYIFYINGGIAKSKEPKWLKKRKRACISGASAYLAPDSRSQEYLEYYGANPEKISLYPYSSILDKEVLETPLTTEEKSKLREQLGIKCEHLYVSSGQFIKRKNYEELLHVWRKMPGQDVLIITGEGPLKDRYLEIIKEYNLQNVALWPYLPHDQLFELYRAADAFVFLSKEDIYGHVVNEALSQGLPVVAGENVNAARHLLSDKKNGFVVKLGDEQTILEALENVLQPEYAVAAIAKAKKNTMETSAAYHCNYFQQYLEGLHE